MAAEPAAKTRLYDTAADGKQQISDALKTAQVKAFLEQWRRRKADEK